METIQKMTVFIAVFLAFALIIMSIVLVMITSWYSAHVKQSDEDLNRIQQLEADNKTLLSDKRELINRNDELYADNVKLTDAVKELREINKQLTDHTAVQVEEPAPADSKTMPLPDLPTNTYRCEPYQVYDDDTKQYKSAFATNSEQAALQKECTTDIKTGIRTWSDGNITCYCAAMATAYGTEIGRCYQVTLECGSVFNVIVADSKHDITNPRPNDYGDADINYDNKPCINIIEFVVDMNKIPVSVQMSGTMSVIIGFGGLHGDGGNIVEIKDIGRRWKP